MIEPTAALATLLQAPVSRTAERTAASGETAFAALLGDMAGQAVRSVREAEAMSADGLTGNAGTREVAEAVMRADRDLQTAVAIRERVITSWLEISRMAI